ncbi:succinate CoA transferase [Oleispirillum naphthae]|uniref:succinate CoA transferase n=1 Tax=Oleispirillum naphthae TaxID=2838853 RepID=UPI0030825C1F
MLQSDRLRHPSLFDKIVPAETAAALIADGMTVGVSGFTPSGYPKKTTLALAAAIRAGRRCRINLMSGASVGPEIEDALAAVGGVTRRTPYYAASNAAMREGINRGAIAYTDVHLSHLAQHIDYGFLGPIDVAIVEAVAVTENGDLVLGPGVGNTPMFVKHAKTVIVEVNTAQPLALEGMHDIFILPRPPHRRELPIYEAGDRIGSPYLTCGLERIAAIVESDIPDRVRNLVPPTPENQRMAGNLLEFLKFEQRKGRLPSPLLPLQSGVGSIANAVLECLAKSELENLTLYSEILQDAVFTLIASGKVKQASGCAFTPSPNVMKRFLAEPELYRKSLILRPLDISNHPEVIRRLGVIAINTPLEFDVYGNANSTHTGGTMMMNGIGGSGDYMRNGYLGIFITESTAKNGAISRIVPMVAHTDHTEHDTMIFITEHGVADVRGLDPRERARVIVNNCADPRYRPLLLDYLRDAEKGGGHTPQDLAKAHAFHIRFNRTGSMDPERAPAVAFATK